MRVMRSLARGRVVGNDGDGQVSVGALEQVVTKGRAWSPGALSMAGDGGGRGRVCGDSEYGVAV